jgi:murein DD-endopeptidase MepM/ murein hydrolase activator NlpD
LSPKLKSGPQKRNYSRIFIIFVLCVAAAGIWVGLAKFEGTAPAVRLTLASEVLNEDATTTVSFKDRKSGLKRIYVSITKDDKTIVLAEKTYPAEGMIPKGVVRADTLKLPLSFRKIGISDGEVLLRVNASDYSWRNWFHGNQARLEKRIQVDTKPPVIDVLTRRHNINQGGTGMLVFTLSEPCKRAGVRVGEKFYPAYRATFENRKLYVVFFAVGYNQPPETEMVATATDAAGNTGKTGFHHNIRKRRFKTDIIPVTDGFLQTKMPEFDVRPPSGAENPMLAQFLEVNRTLRRNGYETMAEVGRTSDPEIYWEGPFLRFSGARRAGFADHREYRYRQEIIDRQVHLGIDLASVPRAPVAAANHGKVKFVNRLGIYGNTVIIDHGMGLMSTYSHLSRSTVKQGDTVKKGEIIGYTGKTGMALGDHLHFAILVTDTFVNPIEWWDPHWIEDNIVKKFEDVKTVLRPTAGLFRIAETPEMDHQS